MKRFEFAVAWYDSTTQEFGIKDAATGAPIGDGWVCPTEAAMFQYMGGNGWQLCSVIVAPGGLAYYFQRELCG